MKRRISLILAMTLMATSMWACGKEDEKEKVTEVQPTETQKEDTTETQTDSDAAPEFAYTSVKYDDDYEYFTGEIHCVEVTDGNHQALADALNDYFSDAVKDFNKTCESMVQDAKQTNDELSQDKTENEGAENEYVYDYTAYYEYDISVQVARCDNQMFSIYIDEYSFTGGAHGGTNRYGITFDTQTGEILENSSFDQFADIIKDEILKEIDSSTQDCKDQLYPEYKDEVERISTEGLAIVGTWFNERGIVVAFPQYTIAPYAAGIITFNIPYSKLEGFDEKYIPTEEFYTADISPMGLAEMLDINEDGQDEVVYLETVVDEENFTNSYILHVGEETIELGDSEEYYYCEPMFVHSSTGNYIMMQTSGDGVQKIDMYNLDKNNVLIQSLDGFIQQIFDGKVVVDYRVDAFGTWDAVKEYSYDGNGFNTTETNDKLLNDPRTYGDARGITLLKKLTYTNNDGDTETLDKGTVIYPITNYDGQLEFVNEDGSVQGYFNYEYKDGEHFVDGVSEYELFENMPYAG